MFNKFILLVLGCGFAAVLGEGMINVTHLKYTKTCSCGLAHGGAIVQDLTKKFKVIAGAFWDTEMDELFFTDKFGGSASGYRPETGLTLTMNIKELRHQEVAAVFTVKHRENEYVIAANQTLYLLKIEGEDLKETYTIKEIMKVMNDSQVFTKATTTIGGGIIIGTVSTDYKDPNFKGGHSQFLHINVTTKKVEVVDDGFDFTAGVSFCRYYQSLYLADAMKNKIWSYKYNCTTGKASDKELIFDMEHHSDTVHGRITGITTDTEGNLWIGLIESYQILVFDTVEHKIIAKIPVPTSAVITLAWGMKHYDTLFAGTEQLYPVKDPKQEPASGRLLSISGTGHRGWQLPKVHIAKDE